VGCWLLQERPGFAWSEVPATGVTSDGSWPGFVLIMAGSMDVSAIAGSTVKGSLKEAFPHFGGRVRWQNALFHHRVEFANRVSQ